jgi:hypothetical protein
MVRITRGALAKRDTCNRTGVIENFKGVRIMWMLVAVFCAIYAFVGIAVCVLAITTGNWMLIVLALLAYVLNLALLSYAKKKSW